MSEPGAAGEKYRQIVDECFSRVVLENDLKPFGRELGKNEAPNSTFRHSYTANTLAWLNERGYTIRGHYLLWGPFEPWSEKLRGDSQKIRQRINDHMDEVLSATGTKVTEWDAINHPASWDPANRVDRVVGPTLYAETMRRARGATKLPLWVNEDQVFRPGRQQEDYFREIEALIAAGLPPDGIGNMAHFDSSFLPSPEEMLRISDRFARLVPRLQITEFDVVTNGDEALQADFLRDALIVAFSHPAYTGFVMWGFWERAHWKPEAALWRGDWTEKAAAAIWKEWVCNRWRTKHKATITGTDTPIQFSGFFGQYEVVVKKAGAETRRFFVNLVPERKSVILQ
jgi:GH35 family endo-1,4-beta-xylanase